MPSTDPGTWSVLYTGLATVLDSKVTAIHAVLVRTGQRTSKILYWHMRYFPALSAFFNYPYAFPIAETEQVPPYDNYPELDFLPALFCGGHVALDNGKIMVAGGEVQTPPDNNAGLKFVYIYNPVGNAGERWTNTDDDMTHGRWYPTLTGWVDSSDDTFKVIAMSGFTEEGTPNLNTVPGIYTPATGWTNLTSIDAVMPLNKTYPGAHVIPLGDNEGKIFYSMPMTQAKTFDPLGTGDVYWADYGTESSVERFWGNSVLLPILPSLTNAKVLIIGGNDDGNTTYDTAEIIELDDSPSTNWNELENTMSVPRANSFSILLPDQTIFIAGGNSSKHTIDPVLTAELLDVRDQDNLVTNGEFLPMATATVPRNYHSTGLLMMDGTVMCLGGRLTTTDDIPYGNDFESDIERRFELYTPVYLTDGDRPFIDDCTEEVGYDENFEITLDATDWVIDSFVLIRPGAATHGLDMEQRLIVLEIVSSSHGVYTVKSPKNYNVAPPGYYMLFAVLDKTESNSGDSYIPSIAVFVKLSI